MLLLFGYCSKHHHFLDICCAGRIEVSVLYWHLTLRGIKWNIQEENVFVISSFSNSVLFIFPSFKSLSLLWNKYRNEQKNKQNRIFSCVVVFLLLSTISKLLFSQTFPKVSHTVFKRFDVKGTWLWWGCTSDAVFSFGPLTPARPKKGNEASGVFKEQVLWGKAEGAGVV